MKRKSLYHLFINAALEFEGGYNDRESKRAQRSKIARAYKEAYQEFKKKITRKATLREVEYRLRGFKKGSKSKTAKLFRRLFKKTIKEAKLKIKPTPETPETRETPEPSQTGLKSDFLTAFVNSLNFLDARFIQYLEQFTVLSEESRFALWDKFSSILKAVIDYVSRELQGVVIEPENFWMVEVRGDAGLFKTFNHNSSRKTNSMGSLKNAISRIMTMNGYNPALYIEVVETEKGVFNFDYLYGRDDEAVPVPAREPDYSIYQNANY